MYLRSIFEEFKENDSGGEVGITRDRLEEVANFLRMSFGNRETDLIFKTLDKDGSGVLTYLEFNKFFQDTSSRGDLTYLLEEIHGDYQHNKLFQLKLYGAFDS